MSIVIDDMGVVLLCLGFVALLIFVIRRMCSYMTSENPVVIEPEVHYALGPLTYCGRPIIGRLSGEFIQHTTISDKATCGACLSKVKK